MSELRVGLLAITIAGMAASVCDAQWEMENSHTTAELRGVAHAGGGVAWASGSEGTVLRTVDGGKEWQHCVVPRGGEHLDFRGVQALDGETALVMSAGKGDLSRIYKTTDGCKTWELLFTNPDAEGFWDAIYYDANSHETFVLGDPVGGVFVLFHTTDGDGRWVKNWNGRPLKAFAGQTLFAASNSILTGNVGAGQFSFVTGGSRPEIIHNEHGIDGKRGLFSEWSRSSLPLASGESGGAFSMASAPYRKSKDGVKPVVVVGGDYRKPDQREGTAAFSTDGGYTFSPARTLPSGYRSAVAYDRQHKFWITVGPNGTDISGDDGRDWYRLAPRREDTAGSDKEWNALSLPFAVGPRGRIGKLRSEAGGH